MALPRETNARAPRAPSGPGRWLTLASAALTLSVLGLVAALPGARRDNPEAGSATVPPPTPPSLARPAPADAPRPARPPRAGVHSEPTPAPAPRGLAPSAADLALQLDAPPRPVASLAAANAKLAAKVAAKQAKAEAKIAKLAQSIASKQALSAQHAVDIVVDEQLVELIEGFVELAEDDLAAAQALPEATPEQLEAKLEAVAHAELGVKLANKELAAASKAVAKHQQAMDTLDAQVVTLQGKQADQEDLVDDHEDHLAALAAPFDFETTSSHTVGLLVRGGGDDLVGARVQLADPLGKPKGKVEQDSGAVWFDGFTDADGRIDTSVTLPDTLEQIDVIIDADGFTGGWTWPGHQQRAGIFAPSKRVTIAVSALADREFQLVEETP